MLSVLVILCQYSSIIRKYRCSFFFFSVAGCDKLQPYHTQVATNRNIGTFILKLHTVEPIFEKIFGAISFWIWGPLVGFFLIKIPIINIANISLDCLFLFVCLFQRQGYPVVFSNSSRRMTYTHVAQVY